jgi:hypothetical protein
MAHQSSPFFEKFGFLCFRSGSCEALSLSLSVLDFKIVKKNSLLISTTQQLKNFPIATPTTPKNQKKKQKKESQALLNSGNAWWEDT